MLDLHTTVQDSIDVLSCHELCITLPNISIQVVPLSLNAVFECVPNIGALVVSVEAMSPIMTLHVQCLGIPE